MQAVVPSTDLTSAGTWGVSRRQVNLLRHVRRDPRLAGPHPGKAPFMLSKAPILFRGSVLPFLAPPQTISSAKRAMQDGTETPLRLYVGNASNFFGSAASFGGTSPKLEAPPPVLEATLALSAPKARECVGARDAARMCPQRSHFLRERFY